MEGIGFNAVLIQYPAVFFCFFSAGLLSSLLVEGGGIGMEVTRSSHFIHLFVNVPSCALFTVGNDLLGGGLGEEEEGEG